MQNPHKPVNKCLHQIIPDFAPVVVIDLCFSRIRAAARNLIRGVNMGRAWGIFFRNFFFEMVHFGAKVGLTNAVHHDWFSRVTVKRLTLRLIEFVVIISKEDRGFKHVKRPP